MTSVVQQARVTARVTSPLVTSLENIWHVIREHHPELPAVAFVIGAGTGIQPGAIKAGHFQASRWKTTTSPGVGSAITAELFVAGELLSGPGNAQGPVPVLETLLHEGAHALADVRDIDETSRGGRYHNRRYAALAEELGLHVEQTGTIGWSATSITEATRNRYAAALAQLGADMTAYRKTELDGASTNGGRKTSNNGLSLACPTCGRKIRLSIESHSAGPILCMPCAADLVGNGRDNPELCTFGTAE